MIEVWQSPTLDLELIKNTILVMGGSQGAQALNTSIVRNLDKIKDAGMQIYISLALTITIGL